MFVSPKGLKHCFRRSSPLALKALLPGDPDLSQVFRFGPDLGSLFPDYSPDFAVESNVAQPYMMASETFAFTGGYLVGNVEGYGGYVL